MNREQVAELLGYASAVDPRIRRNHPDERRLQVEAWARQLGAVDFAAACRAVDEHYARPGADAVLPGDVRHATAGSAAVRHPSARPAAEVLAEMGRTAGFDAEIVELARRWQSELGA